MSSLKFTKPATVNEIITRYMTRYRRLDELIPYAFNQYNVNDINLFIDLYGLYRTLFSRRFRTEVSDYRDFTVGIVNICSHYRGYFKELGVHTNIFLISSYNIPDQNLKLNKDYNKIFSDKLHNKVVKEMIEANIQLLKVLCPYLPDIYFIHSSFESACTINEIINRESKDKPNIPNLIISSDLYPIQLTYLLDHTSYLWPSKYMGQDRSMIVCPKTNPEHKKSFWWIISRKLSVAASEQSLVQLSTSNFTLLSSLNRFPERNLEPALKNITTSIKIINNLTKGEDIRITPSILFSYKDKSINIPDEYKPIIDTRFKCMDLNFQNIYYNESLEPKTLHYENLYDPDALRAINDKYFANNPMDITRL